MYKTELEKGAYYDFVLTNDCRSFNRNINDSILFHIDVTLDLCDKVGKKLTEDVILKNISLTGYDNFFITPEYSLPDVIIDPEIEYNLTSGDTFCLHEVSGYTKNLKYNIEKHNGYNQLDGGFYQGFFKLFGYPVEFFPERMRKGWSVNMLIHLPTGTTTGVTTGTTTGTTLNDIFHNDGFIFYIGTRAENKFSDFTDVEITKLKDEYSFEFLDTKNLYTVNYYTLGGNPYIFVFVIIC